MTPPNGKFRISRFADTKQLVINRAQRFRQVTETTPGPSSYQTPDDLNPKGKFILSQRRGKGTRPFDK
jgi:hypothetical protein